MNEEMQRRTEERQRKAQEIFESYLHEPDDSRANTLLDRLFGYKPKSGYLTQTIEAVVWSRLAGTPNRYDNLYDIVGAVHVDLMHRLQTWRANHFAAREVGGEPAPVHSNISAYAIVCAKHQWEKWNRKRTEHIDDDSLETASEETERPLQIATPEPTPEQVVAGKVSAQAMSNLIDTLTGLKFASLALNTLGEEYNALVRRGQTTLDKIAVQAEIEDRLAFRSLWYLQPWPWEDFRIAEFYPSVVRKAQFADKPKHAMQVAVGNARDQARVDLMRRQNLIVRDDCLIMIWRKVSDPSLSMPHARIFLLHCHSNDPRYGLVVLLANRQLIVAEERLDRARIADLLQMGKTLEDSWNALPLSLTALKEHTNYRTDAVIDAIYKNVEAGVKSYLSQMHVRPA
jgi:hypothetical protein